MIRGKVGAKKFFLGVVVTAVGLCICTLNTLKHAGWYGDLKCLIRKSNSDSKILARPFIRPDQIDTLLVDSPILLHAPQNCYDAVDLQGNNQTLCSNQVLVGVMSSRSTADRYLDGPYLEWTKYKENMIVHLYTPSQASDIKEAISVDCAEREDNQIAEFSLATFKKMYRDHPHMKWYLKFDDDAVLFPSNFLHRLAFVNPNKAVIGGNIIPEGCFSGGAGYFLSNSAMKILVERADECLDQHVSNRSKGGPEDVIITQCVRKFFGDQLVQVHIQEMYPLTYENSLENLLGYAPNGVLPYPISFHWIKTKVMTMMLLRRTAFVKD